jgi:hypothetical protein
MARGSYLVETTRGHYKFHFNLYLIDEQRPAMEGLYWFELYKVDEWDEEAFYGPGIYYPGRSEIYRREPE